MRAPLTLEDMRALAPGTPVELRSAIPGVGWRPATFLRMDDPFVVLAWEPYGAALDRTPGVKVIPGLVRLTVPTHQAQLAAILLGARR